MNNRRRQNLNRQEREAANKIVKVLDPLALQERKQILTDALADSEMKAVEAEVKTKEAEAELALSKYRMADAVAEWGHFAAEMRATAETQTGAIKEQLLGDFHFSVLADKEHMAAFAGYYFLDWKAKGRPNIFSFIHQAAKEHSESFDRTLSAAEAAINDIQEYRADHKEILNSKDYARLAAYRDELREKLTRMETVSDAVFKNDGRQRSSTTTFIALASHGHGQAVLAGLIHWAENAFPQITMGHKYAAALLVTNISGDVVDLIKPPFTAFVIELPEGLLWIRQREGTEMPLRRILVSQYAHATRGTVWSYVAMTSESAFLYRFGVTTAELLPPLIENSMMIDYGTSVDDVTQKSALSTEDGRVASLIGRLILGTCLAMADPEAVKPIGAGHKASRELRVNARGAPEPVIRTFQVGRPVIHDFREEVARYIKGGERLISVQTLVAGHFRNQPYGPKSSLRKTIWIQPFWRGPEDAPIVVRPHILKPAE